MDGHTPRVADNDIITLSVYLNRLYCTQRSSTFESFWENVTDCIMIELSGQFRFCLGSIGYRYVVDIALVIAFVNTLRRL